MAIAFLCISVIGTEFAQLQQKYSCVFQTARCGKNLYQSDV